MHPKKAPGFYDLKSRKTLVRPALPGAVFGQSAIKGACPYSCNLFAMDLVTPKAVTFVPIRRSPERKKAESLRTRPVSFAYSRYPSESGFTAPHGRFSRPLGHRCLTSHEKPTQGQQPPQRLLYIVMVGAGSSSKSCSSNSISLPWRASWKISFRSLRLRLDFRSARNTAVETSFRL